MPRRSHLYSYHKLHGKLVEFAGFEMPIWFEGVIPEHNAVRNSAGLFDVSHMGRAIVTGRDSPAFLDYVATNDVSRLEPMHAVYTLMCNERGGIVDDLLIYRLADQRFFLVYNASNRAKDFNWIVQHTADFAVQISDVSDNVGMMALQGPKAERVLQRLTGSPLAEVKRFSCMDVELDRYRALIGRTGYTGEDGFEIYLWDTPVGEPAKALDLWNRMLDEGKSEGVKPCGLGARDSLRLEAGLSLYGNDIDEETNPFEARISFAVKLKKKGSFIGKDALLAVNEAGVRRTRIGIRMIDPGIPRHGYEIWDGGSKIGGVTSGGYSPTLDVGIAMGYVDTEYRKLGTPVRVRIRERLTRGEIVKFHPFYDEAKYGYERIEK